MNIVKVVLMLAVSVNCWTVDYYLGKQCMGEFLGSAQVNEEPGACVDVNVANIESVQVVQEGNIYTELIFYQGNGCNGQIIGTTVIPECIPFAVDGFGSILVRSKL